MRERMEVVDQPPMNLRALSPERSLEVTWEAGHVGVYGYRSLRGECPCASCVDEWTGVRRLVLDSISPDILLTNMKLVGQYAIKIDWSDGHNTGLYTWNRLRGLCPCPKCRAVNPATDSDHTPAT